MEPGPAFIMLSLTPWLSDSGTDNEEWWRDEHGVPDGYVWQDATIGTGAGWVRPRGGNP